MAKMMYMYFVMFCHMTTLSIVRSLIIPDKLQSVQISHGEIIGHLEDVEFDGVTRQVTKFLGIPYAEPPVGNLRFRKPVPKSFMYSHSPFMANWFGPQCPSYPGTNESFSEDCLYLNVYVPVTANQPVGSSGKPVMIWIHGGGFTSGSANGYSSEVLSTFTDVIVVTLNYRLGPLGFFSTHDSSAAGNFGLWDQHLAIQWVHNNIASFGGQNDDMTIFGESAGSSSVVYQMIYPGNKGLFKRAIAGSGTVSAWGVAGKEANYKASISFAASIGCTGTVHNTIMACLRAKSVDEMVETTENVFNGYFDDVQPEWAPVFDDDFVIELPQHILAEMSNQSTSAKYKNFFDTDLMIGVTTMEGVTQLFGSWPPFLSQAVQQNPLILFENPESLSSDDFARVIVPRASEAFLRQTPSAVVNKAVKWEYTNWENPNDALGRLKNAIDIATDSALNAPTVTTADVHMATNQNTYLYQFATSVNPPPIFGPNDAYHGSDLAYVFGMRPGILTQLTGTETNVTDEMIKVSKAVMTWWTNFAKTGNPNTPVDVRQLYDINWQNYGKDKNYLEITSDMTQESMKTRLAARAVEFWNKIVPKLQNIPCQNTQN